jgi:hypothetical protein
MVEQLVADAVGTPEPVEAHENSKSPKVAVAQRLEIGDRPRVLDNLRFVPPRSLSPPGGSHRTNSF